MDIQERYAHQITKFADLKRVAEDKFKFSNVLLFREYQSRLYAWKQALSFDGNDLFNKRKAYHDLFIDLKPVWIKELVKEEEIVNDLNAAGWPDIRSGFREYMGYFMFLYINWEIFKNQEEIMKYAKLPHPYEPLFMILKRQGIIDFSDSKFVINNRTYLKYDNHFKMPSIDDSFLDFIDVKARDFPNQQVIERFWDGYNSTRS